MFKYQKISSKKISLIYLFFSLFLLAYLVYKSYFVHSGEKNDYYYKYYLISIFIIFISLITFKIPKYIKVNINISLFSIIITLYTIEFLLESSVFKKIYLKIITKNTISYDTRSKLEVYNDLKQHTNVSVPIVFLDLLKKNIIFFPLSGVANSITLNCNESGYYSTYSSDQFGFNNPHAAWTEKGKKIILLGDSFVLGSCVNEPYDIASQLRILLKNNSVINLGYVNSGPLLEYARLREFLPHTETNKVLFFYYEGNDLDDLDRELKNNLLIKYLNNKNFSQNLYYKQFKTDNYAKNFINESLKIQEYDSKNTWGEGGRIIYFIKLSQLRTQTLEHMSLINIKSKETPNKPSKEFIKIISQAKNFSNQYGSDFYFVYLPTYYRYKVKNYDNNYFAVKKIINDLNINFIDIQELFSEVNDPTIFWPFKKDGHYTPYGYKIIAEKVFSIIDK
jgi:hypothetical protein